MTHPLPPSPGKPARPVHQSRRPSRRAFFTSLLEPLENRLLLSVALAPLNPKAVVPAAQAAPLSAAAQITPADTAGTITITGNSTSIANTENAPSATNFTDFSYVPLANINGSVTRTYTIQNTGTNTLTLTGNPLVTMTGADPGDFTVTSLPASTVAPGGSTTFTITFAPSAAGERTAIVNITSSDTTTPDFTFAIQGDALATTNNSDSLQYATVQAGTGSGTLVGQGLTVTYIGTLLNGTVFDSTAIEGGNPFAFSLGEGQVIPGWDEGLIGMEVGETRALIIPSALGYMDKQEGNIPPSSTLIFQVNLVSISGPTINLGGQEGTTGTPTTINSGDTTISTTDGTAFDDVPLNASATNTFTITNIAPSIPNGGPYLNILGTTPIQIAGADADQFVPTQPMVNSQQTALTFTITYQPTVLETATATVTIPTNDPATPFFTFNIGAVLPDLSGTYASSFTVPSNVAPGTKLSVPVVITNAGPGTAYGTIDLFAQASPNTTWSNANAKLGSLNNVTIDIAAGASQTFTIPVTIPPNASLAPGTYDLLTMITPVTDQDSNSANNLVSLEGAAPVTLNVTGPGPDLEMTLGAPTPNNTTYVPGDKITVPVTVTNTGDLPAVASAANPILIDLRASTTNSYSGSDTLLDQLLVKSSIAAGATVKLSATFTLPPSFPAGSTYIVSLADASNVVIELNENNNTAATANPLNVAWEFGNIPGRKGATKLTLSDPDGTLVTFTLAGPGLGQVALGDSGLDVTLTSTTQKSSLAITAKRSTTPGDNGLADLHSITVGNPATQGDDTSLGAINAPTTNLAGDLTVTGELAKLTLDNTTAPSQFTIGSPVKPTDALTITLGNADALSITSGLRIATLSAKSWVEANNTPNLITAPSLATLKITGSFSANLTLSGAGLATTANVLGAVTIAGTLSDSDWYINGKTGTLAFNALDDSDIFAGTDTTVTTLPQAADFTNQNASIASLTVHAKGIASAFLGSNIAAWKLTTVNIAGMDTDNSGTPFGLAAHEIDSLTITPPTPAKHFTKLLGPLADQSPLGGDFVLRLV